ncbi:hypothetical protein [Aestuariivita sp.]|jgi:hypothetical protein|uniref:hypothetical protein n=1 Tax=Aestuariivita sp. TaxID=1872407 RepID=UPI00216FEAD8|nr:hypothetical protein [Aestuariivita sp.]MCE8006286.1 hypothetical protein [Aestuariivita sp.]
MTGEDISEALWVAGPSAVVFGALTLMSDRPRGALIAQCIMAVAGAVLFMAILREAPLMGISPLGVAALATGVISAAIAGMFYHLYLGRFERVWAARGVFTALYLGLSALLGLLFLSLI